MCIFAAAQLHFIYTKFELRRKHRHKIAKWMFQKDDINILSSSVDKLSSGRLIWANGWSFADPSKRLLKRCRFWCQRCVHLSAVRWCGVSRAWMRFRQKNVVYSAMRVVIFGPNSVHDGRVISASRSVTLKRLWRYKPEVDGCWLAFVYFPDMKSRWCVDWFPVAAADDAITRDAIYVASEMSLKGAI